MIHRGLSFVLKASSKTSWPIDLNRATIFTAISCIFLTSFAAPAADGTRGEVDYPLFIVNAASISRLRDNAGAMFQSADRADMTGTMDQWMVDSLKETKGFDRSRPFGMMFYMRPDAIFPIGVSYMPITNLDEALATLAYGTGTIIPVEGRQDRNDIEYVDGKDKPRIRTLYRDGYLFVVTPDGNSSTLDREFPNPEKLAGRISSQYDIAVSLLIKTIPVGLKTIFLTYFKTQLTANLQQRDDEPEASYRLRRANGEGWNELIAKVISEGNEVTLGAKLDAEQKSARVELEIAGGRDSKLAKFFETLSAKKTYFGNVISNPSTLTLSLSVLLEEKQRPQFVKFFEAVRKDFLAEVHEDDRDEFQKLAEPIAKALSATSESGHLDAFVQLAGDELNEFSLVGGIKLSASRDLPQKLREMLEFLKEGASETDTLTKLDLGVESIESLPVHELPIDPPGNFEYLFGNSTSLYLCATPQAVWFSFGGDTALQSLRSAIHRISQPEDPAQGRNRVPLQLVMRARTWLALSDGESENRKDFVKRAEASFTTDNDTMNIEVRPTDGGLRIRADFQSGFIAFMGRGITTGIENGAFTPQPRRRNRENGSSDQDSQSEPAGNQGQRGN